MVCLPMFSIAYNRCRYFCITQTTAERHYSAFFSSGHISKTIFTKVTTMKKQIVEQAVSILPYYFQTEIKTSGESQP